MCVSVLPSCAEYVSLQFIFLASELGKYNLVLIIKSPGHTPELREGGNSWHFWDVRINISRRTRGGRSALHHTAGTDAPFKAVSSGHMITSA